MDTLTIFTFLFFTGLVGLITWLKTRNAERATNDDYFLGGRSLTGLVIASSLLLTNLNATNFVGMAEQSFTRNMSVMAWEVTSGLALVFVAIYLAPRFLKAAMFTIPDFLEERYDKSIKKFTAVLFIVFFMVNVLPTALYAGSVAMSRLFNLEEMLNLTYFQSIALTVFAIGIVGSVYAIFGGMRAVAVSDAINGVGLLIGGLSVPLLGLYALGDGSVFSGMDYLITHSPEKLNAIGSADDHVPFSTLFTGIILVNLYYWGTDQSIIQRVFAAKDLAESQKGLLLAAMLKILTPIILIIPGIIAYHMVADPSSIRSDAAYTELVRMVMPEYFLGFFAAVIFGSIISTYNSLLNSCSTLFAMNIYKPYMAGKITSDSQIIRSGKGFACIISLISMIIAPFIMFAEAGLFQYLQSVSGYFTMPILAIIVVGYASKRVPALAAKVSTLR